LLEDWRRDQTYRRWEFTEFCLPITAILEKVGIIGELRHVPVATHNFYNYTPHHLFYLIDRAPIRRGLDGEGGGIGSFVGRIDFRFVIFQNFFPIQSLLDRNIGERFPRRCDDDHLEKKNRDLKSAYGRRLNTAHTSLKILEC
jgi:hypothetical protein